MDKILKSHSLHIKNVFNGHVINTTAYNVTGYLAHVCVMPEDDGV